MMERRCSCLVVTSGNPASQIEAHLIAEHAQRAGAGAVLFARAVLADVAQEIEILPH